eukprot:gb/GECG01014364.1/.p1 GENE.gb/GECG01014364.1/~~gb/GECG01014364.1/.p1  ORF type:complete len:116 (+),score=1.54 gb/GECG01014364.1/:1-348(+)
MYATCIAFKQSVCEQCLQDVHACFPDTHVHVWMLKGVELNKRCTRNNRDSNCLIQRHARWTRCFRYSVSLTLPGRTQIIGTNSKELLKTDTGPQYVRTSTRNSKHRLSCFPAKNN